MNQVDFYEETAVTTQNKGHLVVMLYDGAVKFLKQAVSALEAGDFENKGRHIVRAQDIIFELNTVLDMEAGGEITRNLRQLYHFMWNHLNQANIECNPQLVREVIGLMEEINQGWKAISV